MLKVENRFFGLDYLNSYKSRFNSGSYSRIICVGPKGSGRESAIEYIVGSKPESVLKDAHKLPFSDQLGIQSSFLVSDTLLSLCTDLLEEALIVRTRKPSPDELKGFMDTLIWPEGVDKDLILGRCSTYKEIVNVFKRLASSEELEKVLGITYFNIVDTILSSLDDFSIIKEACKELCAVMPLFDVYHLIADRCFEIFDKQESLYSVYGEGLLFFSSTLRRSARPATHVTELITDILFLKKRLSQEASFLKSSGNKEWLEKTSSRTLSQRKLIKKPKKDATILYSAEMLSSRLGIKCQRMDGYPSS